MNKDDVSSQLLNWVRDNGSSTGELTVETPLIADHVLTSLQITDLLLYIERLRNEPVPVDSLKPGAFRNVTSIVEHFFSDGGD